MATSYNVNPYHYQLYQHPYNHYTNFGNMNPMFYWNQPHFNYYSRPISPQPYNTGTRPAYSPPNQAPNTFYSISIATSYMSNPPAPGPIPSHPITPRPITPRPITPPSPGNSQTQAASQYRQETPHPCSEDEEPVAQAAGDLQFAISLLTRPLLRWITKHSLRLRERPLDFSAAIRVVLDNWHKFFPRPCDKNLRHYFTSARTIRNGVSHQTFKLDRYQRHMDSLAEIALILNRDDHAMRIRDRSTSFGYSAVSSNNYNHRSTNRHFFND